MTEVELQERLANIDKLQVEMHKLKIETYKLAADTIHTEKRNKWFEFTVALTVFAAGIAFTKIFL